MKKLFFTIFAVSILAGCASTPIPDMTQEERARKINECQGQILSVLKDPESARFRDGQIGSFGIWGNTIRVWVNAKNSFGGYVGFKPAFCTITPVQFLTIVN